ncbi:MAG: hypothetical protein ACKOGA_14545, partial [Planctomycetaceae bacterium]
EATGSTGGNGKPRRPQQRCQYITPGLAINRRRRLLWLEQPGAAARGAGPWAGGRVGSGGAEGISTTPTTPLAPRLPWRNREESRS